LQDVIFKGEDREIKFPSNSTDLINLFPSNYEILVNQKKLGNMVVKLGGVYTLVVNNGETYETHILTEPNSVHMLWLIPQYIIITAGEVCFVFAHIELKVFLIFCFHILRLCFLSLDWNSLLLKHQPGKWFANSANFYS
jgi:hypothetical protein